MTENFWDAVYGVLRELREELAKDLNTPDPRVQALEASFLLLQTVYEDKTFRSAVVSSLSKLHRVWNRYPDTVGPTLSSFADAFTADAFLAPIKELNKAAKKSADEQGRWYTDEKGY